jgi:periplasmic protein CpxP/Spy
MRFIIVLFLMTGLFADDYGHHNERHINKELSHLDLSKTQNIEVKVILKEFRSQLKEFKEFKENVEEKRKNLFIQDSFDAKELDKLNLSLDDKAHAIEKSFLTKMHTILTPRQRERFIHYFDDWEVE